MHLPGPFPEFAYPEEFEGQVKACDSGYIGSLGERTTGIATVSLPGPFPEFASTTKSGLI